MCDASPLWAEVLVDFPSATGAYTYSVPRDLAVQVGDVVSVGFGRQQVGAIVVRLLPSLPQEISPGSVKPIDSVTNSSFFTKAYWQLLKRVARYYQTPFMQVVRTALPKGLLSRSQRRIRLRKSKLSGKMSDSVGEKALIPAAALLIETLKKAPQGEYSWQYLKRQCLSQSRVSFSEKNVSRGLQQLIRLGWVESYLAAPRSPRPKQRQAVSLLTSAREIATESVALTARQQAILLALAKQGGDLWLSDALQLLKTTSKTLKKLESLGHVVIEPREVLRAGSHSTAGPDQAKTLTVDQAKALNTLEGMVGGYGEALLHGVTGSGKTEVYLQAIAPLLANQKSALVLVPEIGLTPQLTDRFRSRFGEQVCVYHSGLSEGERYDTWRQMLTGVPQVIIGTRSAVFAPLNNLGIIILDEEHDSSFKQDQPMPCYHARQVAQWRAELEGFPLVLGSATPSLETWLRFRADGLAIAAPSTSDQTIAQGLGAAPTLARPSASSESASTDCCPQSLLHCLPLPTRIHTRPLPPVEVVDMRQELHAGNRTIFSRALQRALENLVETGNQGILFIHRRGHSSFVSCRSCGEPMECPNCDVSLSYHQVNRDATPLLRCHYCGFCRPHPTHCPQCQSPYLKNFGSGTQRVVNDLAKYLPQARCIRFDSDTTRNKGAHRALLTRFANGEADLLVGTQMLTKGIDLPQVTLVGVIAADGLLFMPDFRASERAFQVMTQVAGRAGRGEQPGRVIVQTYSPEHVAVTALVAGEGTPDSVDAGTSHVTDNTLARYDAFLQQELSDRAALAYPPYGRLILLRISGLDEAATEKAAHKLSTAMTAGSGTPLKSPRATSEEPLDPVPDQPVYEVLGPVPAPIYRVARRFRWHIVLKLGVGVSAPTLTHLRQQCPKGISLTIDVDPLNLA